MVENRIIRGAQEAVAIASGAVPAPRIHVNGHSYVPEARALAAERQRDDLKAALEEAAAVAGGIIKYLDDGFTSGARSAALALQADLRTLSRLSSEAVSKQESPAPTPPLSKREGAE